MTRALITSPKPGKLSLKHKALQAAEVAALRHLPAAAEWWANFPNSRTKKAYKVDIQDFIAFTGVAGVDDLGTLTRAHVIAWRQALLQRGLTSATIRRKLSALSSLYDYLCENQRANINPVDGVKRPATSSGEGATPIISYEEARNVFDRIDATTLKGKRDRAILAVLLYHALRCNELCRLAVEDRQQRGGVFHFKIHGKRSKIRYVPIEAKAQRFIEEYLEEAGHSAGPLFRPIQNNAGGGELTRALNSSSINRLTHHYLGVGPHALRATAATNALDNDADIKKVQEMLGHSSIATTRIYDRRHTKPEDSPVFRIKY